MTMTPGREFFRVEEVAEKLGISLATAYRRIEDGSIPSVRLKGCIRIPVVAFRQIYPEKVEKLN
jgi:excisionase family DNA binding protein